MSDLKRLSKALNYTFKDESWLLLSLTHRSFSGQYNNERLEFLGDSIVNFVVAEALYHHFPSASEGELSRWRATLINRETLATIAQDFALGQYLRLGPGELKNGGAARTSILSCCMEAIIGAIYLDSGFDVAQQCILNWYKPLIDALSDAADHKDPKSMLQEYLQAQHKPLPVYRVDSIAGEAHKQVFTVSCQIEKIKTQGKGTNRRKAEQDAAEAMLRKLHDE